MKRLKYTVLWFKDRWELRGVGFSVHPRKKDAVAEGRRLCRAHRAAGGRAQLVIKGRKGRILTEHTYGGDPARTPG